MTFAEVEKKMSNVNQKVTVTDINMPFFSMVGFMIKWAIAAIPAMIILYLIGAIFGAFVVGFVGGL